MSVNDIRRAFEKAEQSLSQGGSGQGTPKRHTMSSSGGHNRMSSLDSTTSSEESSIPTPHFHGSVSSLASGHGGDRLKDHYGSITSLASSTSMISPQVREMSGIATTHLTTEMMFDLASQGSVSLLVTSCCS